MFGAKLPADCAGGELLRRRLTGSLALRCLAGTSSPLYTSLYAEGAIRSLWYELDWGPCASYAVLGGESREPEQVLERFAAAAGKAAAEGLDAAAFERCRRAEYGSRIRALERPASLADTLVRSGFAGFDCLRAFELLPEIRAEDCAAFIKEYLAPDRLALSVVRPGPRKD